ncbi:chemotaxis protein CheW [Methanocalculus sp.]|uniref:chemotaxis protein CheW n=1 Tax=Methanocalculus sp. TaxID=2004547 RepID=UPI00271DB504|nr:chemotaxis protein CheW [Methanocalculus sp.]MDO8842678.1 chemotaxis protein CheW [Methanocalculus sp.]
MTELLHFCVRGTGYALPLDRVQSTIRMVAARDQNRGVIDFHGRELAITSIDIHPHERRPLRATDSLIITTLGERGIALCADRIEGIVAEGKTKPGDLIGTRMSEDGRIIIDDLSALPLYQGVHPVADEETEGILKRRAQAMRAPQEEEGEGIYPEILRFQLGYVEYAVEMQYVREVILTGEITPVPGVPAFITGISAVRGKIISLVDLRKFFGIPEFGLTDFNRVIILSDRKMTFGLLTDRILGTSHLKRPIPQEPTNTTIPQSHLIGIADNVIIIDAKALLTDRRMMINELEE